MTNAAFQSRLTSSAQDFIYGVQERLEEKLKITVYPIEGLNSETILAKLDQIGIDAFYFDSRGQTHGLASRINYNSIAALKPSFTFRYALYDVERKLWDNNREYQRKLDAANQSGEFMVFPKLHIESFSVRKGSGSILWSFGAETKKIVNYAEANLDNPEKVRIFEPRTGERRKVLSVSVEDFAREHDVIEVLPTYKPL